MKDEEKDIQIEELTMRIEELKVDYEELKETSNMIEEELEGENRMLRDELDELRDKYESYQEKAKKEIKTLEANEEKDKERVASLEEEVKILKKKLVKMDIYYEDNEAKKRMNEVTLEALENDKNCLEEECEILKTELEVIRNESSTIIKSLEEQINIKDSKIKFLKLSLERENQIANDLKIQNSHLKMKNKMELSRSKMLATSISKLRTTTTKKKKKKRTYISLHEGTISLSKSKSKSPGGIQKSPKLKNFYYRRKCIDPSYSKNQKTRSKNKGIMYSKSPPVKARSSIKLKTEKTRRKGATNIFSNFPSVPSIGTKTMSILKKYRKKFGVITKKPITEKKKSIHLKDIKDNSLDISKRLGKRLGINTSEKNYPRSKVLRANRGNLSKRIDGILMKSNHYIKEYGSFNAEFEGGGRVKRNTHEAWKEDDRYVRQVSFRSRK